MRSNRRQSSNKRLDSVDESLWEVGMKARLLFAVVGVAFFVGMTQTSSAQLLGSKSGKLNSEFVPESACASAAVFPKKIGEDPKLDLFPREIVTAWGLKELGFDPMLLEQVTFVMRTPNNMMAPPVWGAVLRFDEMQGLAGNLIDQLEEKEVNGKTLFSGANGMPSFLV